MFEDIVEGAKVFLIAGVLLGVLVYIGIYFADNPDTVNSLAHAAYWTCQLDTMVYDALYDAVDDPASKLTLEKIRNGWYVTDLAMYSLYWDIPKNAKHFWYDISCNVISG